MKTSKTLVFGPGFLGHRLASALPSAVLSKADITDRQAIERAIEAERPTAVINAAGKTGKPNVDWCESHPFETYRSNVTGAVELAEACARHDLYLLHLGSGCIFYGPSPSPGGWLEDDHANPSAIYSRSKYAADFLLSRLPNVGVARLRMPIDSAPGPRNLITKLASYPRVIDVENSVTVIDDLVSAVDRLVELRAPGVFHVTNPGVMRHRDLLEGYRRLVDPRHEVTFIEEQALVREGLAVRGRSNCILASPRLEALGIRMRPIEVALQDCLERYARASR